MLTAILTAMKGDPMPLPPAEHVCHHCNKAYRRLSTLAVHCCEPKRRHLQKGEPGVRLGLCAFQQFSKTMSNKTTTYNDFCKSPYYIAFVKFGRHICEIRAINPMAYIAWIIKQRKKLDWWCKDAFYEQYLLEYIKTENPQDALERAISVMTLWADNDGLQFNQYFEMCSINAICRDISNGRISPWAVYNSKSGVAFLTKLNAEQLQIIFQWIDPPYWGKKLSNNEDVVWCKDILMAANI